MGHELGEADIGVAGADDAAGAVGTAAGVQVGELEGRKEAIYTLPVQGRPL